MKRFRTLWRGTLLLGLTAALGAGPAQAAADHTYEDMKMLVEVLGLVQNTYVKDVDTKKLVYGAAAGMVRTLDPFSQFLEPEAHKEMKSETEGEFGGLGIRIAMRDNILTVITPLPGTPAYRQGILPGDKIVKIDKGSTQDITITEAVRKLRGAPGSKVELSISREGEKDLLDVTIVRELIKIESISSKMLEDDIGYVRMTEFSQRSALDLEKAIQAMKRKGMKKLVFDLRNNPGGLLNVAVDTCRLFLADEKLIVYTEGRRQPRQEFRANAKAPFANMPLVLLINHGSASGSEIVAGCLQDYHRAILIGAETFGKGSVQSVIPLADGSGLRLTTSKYYTPSGRTFHRDEETGKGGVTPDIVIEVTAETELKLRQQEEEIYSKVKKDKKEESGEKVADAILDRAKEILKVQDILQQMKK